MKLSHQVSKKSKLLSSFFRASSNIDFLWFSSACTGYLLSSSDSFLEWMSSMTVLTSALIELSRAFCSGRVCNSLSWIFSKKKAKLFYLVFLMASVTFYSKVSNSSVISWLRLSWYSIRSSFSVICRKFVSIWQDRFSAETFFCSCLSRFLYSSLRVD